MTVPVEVSPVYGFVAMAKRVADAARAGGLKAPSVQCPPSDPAKTRAIKGTGAEAILFVRFRERDAADVARDLAEGTLVANGLPVDHEARETLIAAALEEPNA